MNITNNNNDNKTKIEQCQSFVIKYVIPVLVVVSIYCGFMFMAEMQNLNKAYADMNDIEFLSSSTQRLISLALTDQLIQKDIFFIGSSTKDALSMDSTNALSVFDKSEMVELAETVYESWLVIEDVIQQEDIDRSVLSIYREAHFKAMTDLSNGIKQHTEELNGLIAYYQRAIMAILSFISAFMVINIMDTHNKLRLSRELAEMAQIDVATGLHNRSSCQDIFKNGQNISSKTSPAILVIDLNDLKKTNDSLGHRVGDELISTFASKLKVACKVNTISPFIGRYGGDEFIVYYENIANETTVTEYLSELEYLTKAENEIESRFKISYAVGYSFLESNHDSNITIRELFDKADENMYENKIAMKRAQNPNYDEQVAKGEDVR